MSKVGIIANPAAGKDIRRLVSYATVIGNTKKIDIVKRVILALNSTGVDEIVTMPDPYQLVDRALDAIKRNELRCQVSIIDMAIKLTENQKIEIDKVTSEYNLKIDNECQDFDYKNEVNNLL